MVQQQLVIYNTLSREKEVFKPLHAPHVGLYVCGPTVYGDPHLGHARPAITFDLLFRYLQHIGYKVRYVRNITDVGHLENDADEGEDKIGKKARLEELEPMEVVQFYTNSYHKAMDKLNVLRPSIEPNASGHVMEQIEMTQEILDKGFAYESNGSVYFDVEKYNKSHHYGILSRRDIDEMLENTRQLDGQDEKRKSVDFALWKKAAPEHIMRWKSPWSEGFPGWHIECSAMSTRYLGDQFDIHGGGLDLLFPHHECEIAQNTVTKGEHAVKYWMHNNMITVNGTKMGKSMGNFINLDEFFEGTHRLLDKPYSPMTIRFFILQSHYRSMVDFSTDAMHAAEVAKKRLLDASNHIDNIPVSDSSTVEVKSLKQKCYDALNDDLNTPILLSHLFEATRIVNSAIAGIEKLSQEDIDELSDLFEIFLHNLLGIEDESALKDSSYEAFEKAVDMLLEMRQEAKKQKDWATSDKIRNQLTEAGFVIKDTADGFEWSLA
ncbi:MAG: cysteine--tRNA ligase [Dysgonamonadaceae bacterium]|nr:cysteine--tRNA ligase [Dysgonamonadaceae bacterium]MDD4727294.1 cysteine--tRNA ligase [Dysgonamonadaceae bacterium]